jgi:type IV secretory pathway VirB10-like protein
MEDVDGIEIEALPDDVNATPPEQKRPRECLEAMLQDTDPLEWPNPPPPPPLVDEEDAFEIPEDQLTDTDEATHEIRVRPAYYDPHETRAVRLRNQMVRQRLALKEARLRQEEEDEDERVRKRRHTEKEIAPTLRHVEAISEVKKTKKKCVDNPEPICNALRGAEHTDFMIRREMRRNDRQSEVNGRMKEEKRQQAKESDRAIARGEKNDELMRLWNPR